MVVHELLPDCPDGPLQAHMEGAAFLTKADTMARADRSSLTSKPGAIYGARPCSLEKAGPNCVC